MMLSTSLLNLLTDQFHERQVRSWWYVLQNIFFAASDINKLGESKYYTYGALHRKESREKHDITLHGAMTSYSKQYTHRVIRVKFNITILIKFIYII